MDVIYGWPLTISFPNSLVSHPEFIVFSTSRNGWETDQFRVSPDFFLSVGGGVSERARERARERAWWKLVTAGCNRPQRGGGGGKCGGGHADPEGEFG